MAKGLQENNDKGHEGLHQAELQRSLLAESQEANGVGLARQAICSIETAGAYGLAPYFRHDISFASQVLIAQGKEIVDDKGFITVPYREEVHIVAVIVEEQ